MQKFLICFLSLCIAKSGISQFASSTMDSKWLYENSGPVADCAFIMLEMTGDTMVEYEGDSIKMKLIERQLLNDEMLILDQDLLLAWIDSLNQGLLISFFEVGSSNITRDDEVFTYAIDSREDEQWHAPINGGFATGKYDAFDIIEEDSIIFNDSVSSYVYKFEKTPENNYMCETVIERIGSVGYMLAINRDKPDYRAGRLLWYYDSEIDTFHVPDTFKCIYTFTDIIEPIEHDQSVLFFDGNQIHVLPQQPGGVLSIYNMSGKCLSRHTISGQKQIIKINPALGGMFIISYQNGEKVISKKIWK